MNNDSTPNDETAIEPAKQQELVEVSYDRATIETVKRTVFPGSTDDELRIYLYKCLIVGVHPLSGMLIPVKYRGKEGEPSKLSFTTTIDCMRSKAQTTGLYDGQDPAVYDGEEVLEYADEYRKEQQIVRHPVSCTMSVYRKDISRPFVATARWTEYYPGDKRGQMWRKMPYVMLSKCAEALAIRKAFPEKLGRIYAIDEMELAAERQYTSSKPPISGPTLPPPNPAQTTPAEIDTSNCITQPQEKRFYAICKTKGVSVDTVKEWLGKNGANRSPHLKHITRTEYERLCKTVEDKPEFFAKLPAREPEQAPPSAPQQPGPNKVEAFQLNVIAMVLELNWDAREAADFLSIGTYPDNLNTIPENKQMEFLSALNQALEAKNADGR